MTRLKKPELLVGKYFAVLGEPLDIVVQNLANGEKISIKLQGFDEKKRQWQSEACFMADSLGIVDIVKSHAFSGTYQGIDALGLFWSMKRANFHNEHINNLPMIENMQVIVKSLDNGWQLSKNVRRVYLLDNIEKIVLRTKEIVGEYFVPKKMLINDEKKSAVIVCGGIEGGIKSKFSALLASHLQCPVLALAYFGKLHLSRELKAIPLETIEKALNWLAKRKEVLENSVAIVGFSKGSELALLAATKFWQIKKVVVLMPSIVLFEGFGKNIFKSSAAWSFRGEKIAYLPFKRSFKNAVKILFCKFFGRAFASKTLFLESMKANEDFLEKATIKIEEAKADILFLGGEKDSVWPVQMFAQMLEQRLKEKKYAYNYQCLIFQGAGHLLTLPYCPLPYTKIYIKGMDLWQSLGGKPSYNVKASCEAWRKIIAFL